MAFNNAKVIEYQIRTLQKYFRTPYRYTVFDNSTDTQVAKTIREVCQQYGIGYVRLPKQSFLSGGAGSLSHGIACNWIFKNFIQQHSAAQYVALLDHDIFCIEDFHIDKILDKQPFYGHVFAYGRKGIKYLWPGFCFFRMDNIKGKTLDFRPSAKLDGDTGVRNYKLYEIENFDEILFAEMKHCRIDSGNDDILGMGYSKFDNEWIHCWNASNYMKSVTLADKMEVIYKILDEKLKEN